VAPLENPPTGKLSGDGSSLIGEAITVGYSYAEKHRNDRPRLGRIARAQSASEVTKNLDPAEIATDGIADPVAFWSGFSHGVRWYLVDEGQALDASGRPTAGQLKGIRPNST
jgi:hypothetical protein